MKMAMHTIDQNVLDAILDQLDLGAQHVGLNEHGEDPWACHRHSPRKPFRSKCMLRFLSGGFDQIGELTARTRNLSRGGLSVLVRRLFRNNDPIEIEIRKVDHPTLYVAGVVAFCRYAGGGYHELGVSLRVADNKPVFSDNFDLAQEKYDWLKVSVR